MATTDEYNTALKCQSLHNDPSGPYSISLLCGMGKEVLALDILIAERRLSGAHRERKAAIGQEKAVA